MKSAGQNWNNDMPPARFIKMTTYNLKRGKASDFFRFWSNNFNHWVFNKLSLPYKKFKISL